MLLEEFRIKYGNQRKLHSVILYYIQFFKSIGCDIHIVDIKEFHKEHLANKDRRWYLLPDILFEGIRSFAVLIYRQQELVASVGFKFLDINRHVSVGHTLKNNVHLYWDIQENNPISEVPEEFFYMHGDVAFIFGLWFDKKFIHEHREKNLISEFSLLMKAIMIGRENPNFCLFMVDPKLESLITDCYHIKYVRQGPTWNGIIEKDITFQSGWLDNVGIVHTIEEYFNNRIPGWKNMGFDSLYHELYGEI